MLPTLAFLLATQVRIDQPPRLRTILPNGVVVLVERRPGAKALFVDLFAASRGTEESSATNGRRHLLEHLVALGPKGDVDRTLETAGGYLTAQTTRDAISFEISLPADGLKLAVSVLKEIATNANIDSSGIERETKLIDEEGALRSDSARASAAAWSQTFGERGLDPFGSIETLRGTKPDELEKLRKLTFAASNLVVVVSGDVDLDQATKTVKDSLGLLPDAKPVKPAEAPAAQNGDTSADVDGEYRGVAVTGFRSPSTAATLAAALALTNGITRPQLIYTPSSRPGLILIGTSEGRIGDGVDKADPAALFSQGRLMAIRWVKSRLADPARAAAFRGMLMAQASDVRPETMLENLDVLSYEEFAKAVKGFQTGGVVVRGRP